MQATERLERERDFHNRRFADDSERERRVGRFYAAIANGYELYSRRVTEAGRDGHVLEYGCAYGEWSLLWAQDARAVTGIDLSEVAILKARHAAILQGARNVDFVVDNAEAMQLPDESVDVIAGSGIVHHLDIPKAMLEVRRVLRAGGVAIFAEPLGHNPLVNWYRKRTPELRTPDEHPLLMHDIERMSREFSSYKVTYFGLISPLLGVFSAATNPRSSITKMVWWLDRQLCRVPVFQRYAWYCVVELRA
jgi:ubiquinone/menaquinone biosynthesis C-methylase UbiE